MANQSFTEAQLKAGTLKKILFLFIFLSLLANIGATVVFVLSPLTAILIVIGIFDLVVITPVLVAFGLYTLLVHEGQRARSEALTHDLFKNLTLSH